MCLKMTMNWERKEIYLCERMDLRRKDRLENVLNPFRNLKLFMQSHNQLMPQFVASILKLNFLKIVLNTCTKIILPSLNTFIRAKLVFVPFSIVMIMSSVLRGICTPYKPTLVSGCSWKFCQTFTFHPKIFKLNREVQ